MRCDVLVTHLLKEGSGVDILVWSSSPEKFVFTRWEVDILILWAFKTQVGSRWQSTISTKTFSELLQQKLYFYQMMNKDSASFESLRCFYSNNEVL